MIAAVTYYFYVRPLKQSKLKSDPSSLTVSVVNYEEHRPTKQRISRWTEVLQSRSLMDFQETAIYDFLERTLVNDLSMDFGDQFTVLVKVPSSSIVNFQPGTLPALPVEIIRRSMVDYLICTRFGPLVPHTAFILWTGESAFLGGSRTARFGDVKEQSSFTSVDWDKWILAGLLEAAGINVYLVSSDESSLSENGLSMDFIEKLERDLNSALRDSFVPGF
jgi:hypothetical protein